MIFPKIKEYFLQKQLTSSLKRKEIHAKNSLVKSIGVLTKETLKNTDDFEGKIKLLLPKYRSVHFYSYREFNAKDEKSFHYFSKNDFNWHGKIKDDSLQSFIDKPFDLLICYFDENHLYLENLAKRSNANFKAGFAKVNQDLYDLEISESITNIDDFHVELKKYLQILGKL